MFSFISLRKVRLSFIKIIPHLKQSHCVNIKYNNPSYHLPIVMNMSRPSNAFSTLGLQPPAEVRGMKSLDRVQFSRSVVVPTIEVDVSDVKILSKNGLLKKYLLKLLNFKPVQDNNLKVSGCKTDFDLPSVQTTTTKRKVHLNPSIKSYNDLEECDREVLKSIGITEQAMTFVNLTLTYENWRADEILKAILPEDKDNVTSFSKIGHIIHLNLRDHVMEYKHIIGQVLLDKVSGAKTVVNKINSISNTYRNFKMELICGENNMMAQVRENSCIYEFDFSLVYWNPRLCTEHERIVKKVCEGDVLYDVFAGVGPFAIPASKKKCYVLANDLNPESYKWLQHNGKLNKVLPFLKTFNKDGGDFLKEDVKLDMLHRWKDGNHDDKFMHITMNLPAIAETFLHVFNGLFLPEEINSINIKHFPTVHLYCFTKGEGDPVKLALNKVEENLGSKLDGKDILEIIHIRTVSSYKEMMRVSFHLSMDILTRCPNTKKRLGSEENCDNPPLKKLNYDQHGLLVHLIILETMGKQKGNSFQNNKKNTSKNKHNNVFKVAGSRCLKIKNKAKAVTSQVKKLNEMNRVKTKEVDSQLLHLQEELLQKPKNDSNKQCIDTKIEVERPILKQSSEKDSMDAMGKLSSMKM